MRTPAAFTLSITRRDFLRALCVAIAIRLRPLATRFTALAADLGRLTCWRSSPTDLLFAGAR